MIWIGVLTVIVIGLFLSGFYSGSETGLYCVNRLRLELGVKHHDIRCKRLVHILDDKTGVLSVTLIGTNIMNYITTIAAAYIFSKLMGFSEADTEIYTVVVLTPIVFVFGEVVPKNLFQLHADQLMSRGSGLLALSYWFFRVTGCIWLLKALSSSVQRVIGVDNKDDLVVTPKSRTAAMLQEAVAERSWGSHHSAIIDRVCQLSEIPLHVAMAPNNRVVSISTHADRRELIKIVRRTGHARLPVFDKHASRIIGLIKVDKLLRDQEWNTVGERLTPITSLRPHVTVANAIAQLQQSKTHLAIVTDHGGKMLGIVTLNDLLQEIVGDLDMHP